MAGAVGRSAEGLVFNILTGKLPFRTRQRCGHRITTALKVYNTFKLQQSEAEVGGLAIWGGLIFLASVGMFAWSFWKSYIPARWPMPRMYNSEHPAYFWLCIGGYAVGAALGLFLAFS